MTEPTKPKRSLAEIIAEKRAQAQAQALAQQPRPQAAIQSLSPATIEEIKQKQDSEPYKAPTLMEMIAASQLSKLTIEQKQAAQKEADQEEALTKQACPASQLPASQLLASVAPATAPNKVMSLKEILAALKDKKDISKQEEATTEKKEAGEPAQPLADLVAAAKLAEQESEEASEYTASTETFALSIKLNKEQLLAKELAFAGKSFCLIGAAGTGKTTAQREIAAELLRQGNLGTHSFRIQGAGARVDAPSIAFVAYTRIAAGNLRRAIHKDPDLERVFEHNVTTIHNLLEYEPEVYFDYETNEEKFRFIPRRNKGNPLDITHLIVEESSMVGVSDLWPRLYDALRSDVQIIFIGDINQLPPVFGASILNYALTQLPIVELTHVYRQKEGSSILDNAHKMLAGDATLIEDDNTKIIRGGTIQYTQSKMALALSASLRKWFDVGEYDPEQDIILSPFNKQDLGTDSMNKYVSQFLGEQRNAVVHEIICGITKVYLAVGDKVLFNKQVGFVSKIVRNGQYVGKAPKTASVNLTRFGVYKGHIDGDLEDGGSELAGYENISLEEIAAQAEQGEKKRQASHIVELEMETGIIETLETVGAFAPQSFSLGYALTVHKAQGCEWRKVFLILHKDHSIMAFRELLYTACTRAREHLAIIAKDTMIQKAIASQRIKGNTLKEKIAFFNAGLMNQEDVRCTK